jgi:hypothetical protein
MPIYSTSRDVGWNSCSNPNWSSFMNSYASTPFNPGQTSGVSGATITGGWNINAPYSGNYTLTVATDDSGTVNYSGSSFSSGGFTSNGNSLTKYFSKGQNIAWSWSVQNSTTSDSFIFNPIAISFTLDGPPQPAAPSVSISLNPTSIINNGSSSSTLSWSATGNVSSVTVTDVSSPGTSGSRTVQPLTTRTYQISATGEGGTSTAQTTLTVYQPPNLTLSLDRSSIAAGESTTLRWTTTGDASSITWNSGGITNGNLNSNTTVSPTGSQTYSATVSGLGGSDSDSIRLTVYQRPTATLTVPASLDYGQQGVISYESCYSNTSLTITPTYSYYNASGSSTLTGDAINLPTPSSAEQGVGVNCVNGTLNTSIPYTNSGPRTVTYAISAVGSGGNRTVTSDITINIDETPENINVPETEDVYKQQEPVYTPNYEVTSNYLEVIDIDIPVEIKSSRPIKVDKNLQDNWQDLRQI